MSSHSKSSKRNLEFVRSIDEVAADWLARSIDGLSFEEERELSEWLAEDIRHRQMFSELEETWGALDVLQGTEFSKQLSSLLEPQSKSQPKVWKSKRVLFSSLAAAASLAMTFLFWQEQSKTELRYELAVATENNAFRKADLPDGSVLRVNSESSVRVSYYDDVRLIDLEKGEATFTVAHNPARPFIVRVNGVDVRAVGTEFNIRSHSNAVEVLVTQGKVSVSDTGSGKSLLPEFSQTEERKTPVLSAGQRFAAALHRDSDGSLQGLKVIDTPIVVDVSSDEILRELSWQSHRLIFDSVPLSEIVAEFNRYNEHKLAIRNSNLAKKEFGGAFQADDPQALISLLEGRFGVSIEREPNRTILN